MYIEEITIRNIRCFEKLTLHLDPRAEPSTFLALVGDNATGKTTILKAIAMGLCDESSAAGLMREADMGYVRRGTRWGDIKIILRRRGGRRRYCIKTRIERHPAGEQLHQTTDPTDRFPWGELFVSAYGAGRSTSGTGDIADYSVQNAVYNLFNYAEGLQNPELSLHRLKSPSAYRMVLSTLNAFLETRKINVTEAGILVDGLWGDAMPLRDLADGYKSSFLWLTDLLGWAVSRDTSLRRSRDVTGIVLIDEIEQHLHPKWQEQVVPRIRDMFPALQFIATTHSPLVAGSVGGLGKESTCKELYHLQLRPGNRVVASEVSSMRGWRADQVLASAAFDITISSDRVINDLLKDASHLLAKGNKRTTSESIRLVKIRRTLARHMIGDEAETEIERQVQSALDRALVERVTQLTARS
ncbi:MAG: AAA family ATPase [Planctomycetes bacterium]|nr:AAA family ATPase [Planctomycetota bacterium]